MSTEEKAKKAVGAKTKAKPAAATKKKVAAKKPPQKKAGAKTAKKPAAKSTSKPKAKAEKSAADLAVESVIDAEAPKAKKSKAVGIGKPKGAKKSSSLVERVADTVPPSNRPFVGLGVPGGKSAKAPDPTAMGAQKTSDVGAEAAPAEPPKRKSKAVGLGVPGGKAAKKVNTLTTGHKRREELAKSGQIPDATSLEPKKRKSLIEAFDEQMDDEVQTGFVAPTPKPVQPVGAKLPEAEPIPAAKPITQGKPKSTQAKGGPAKGKQQKIDLVALRDAGYITPDMPPNLMSEEFRLIKRGLLLSAFHGHKADAKNRNVDPVENGNIVLVTSSNPSEGKTFCAINLALSIATEQDVTVLLIDADFSKPEVLNRLGVAGGKGLMDVVADDTLDIGECLVRTNIPNLVLLPAGRQHNLTTELLASDRMDEIVNEIANRYPDRLVIFDSPPVLASSAASVLALYAGQAVFVIEAENTTEPQIKESLSMINACKNIGLLLNKTRYSGSNKKFASYYGYGGR